MDVKTHLKNIATEKKLPKTVYLLYYYNLCKLDACYHKSINISNKQDLWRPIFGRKFLRSIVNMLAWSNLQIPNLFLCILLFCKFLMYFIVFISYVFLCFYDFLFFVIWSWLISRYTKLCKSPKRQNKHCFLKSILRKSVISMCFVHKHICKMRILGNFWADVRVQKVAWPRDRWSDFRKLGIKRCARLERKKSWKGMSRSAAVATQSRISCRGGGGQIDPPPPPPPS